MFLFFEPLELFDQIQLEFDRNSRREFERDVLVCVSPAVASGLGYDADGAGFFNPLL
jgi:hypothetical protein